MDNRQLQLYKKQKAMYQSLTEEQLEIVNEYFDNNMKMLKKICDPLIFHKKVPESYHEDLYGVASDVLIESLIGFDPNKKCSFKTFLMGNIKRAFYDWTRDSTRLCRCNIQTDAEGKIVRDKDGNVIIIPSIPFDEPAEDGTDMKEKIASDFNIEDNLPEEIGFSSDNTENWHPVVKDYLNGLSPLQRKIILMLSRNKDRDEICKTLNITYNHYENSLKRILADERIKPLRPLAEGKYYEVVTRQN